ncbi:MAG: glutamine synthetase family protein [Kiloniellales bacterium]
MPDTQQGLPKEAADFLVAHPETVAIDAIYPDLSGVIRGKRYPVSDLDKIMGGGLAFPGSVFLLDTMGESHDPGGKGFSDGDPDCKARVIPGSLKPVPWAERPLGQVMVTLETSKGGPYPFEPRSVLAATLARVKELGYRPMVAFELEFYLIDRERTETGAPQPPISPLTGQRDHGTQVYGMNEVDAYADLLEDITEACAAQDIPTGAASAEYAPGQFEINLNHIDDPLLAADHCVMFKRVVKGVVRRYGMQATFMPKPYLDCAGSGLHIHVSLYDKKGRNVFAGEDGSDPRGSDLLRHGIGGVLELLPESMSFLAPNVNSFRRFEPNIFVPITRSWGYENRSVALRVPLGGPQARRIEHRVAGADANPYLALATCLAGVHHGIVNKLNPGEAATGNAGKDFDDGLPFRPRRALDTTLQSKVLPDYFGAEYLRAYVECKMAELEKFEWEITPIEYSWYLQAE